MPGSPLNPAEKSRIRKMVGEGWTIVDIAAKLQRDMRTVRSYINGLSNGGDEVIVQKALAELPGPIPYEDLSETARRGWDDFEFFRMHYLGRVSDPWQVEAGYIFREELKKPDRSFLVLNCPPGTGKTTLMHDIGAWLTVQDRRLRSMMGSHVTVNAERMLLRLRRTFERTTPPKARPQDISRGLAVDAGGCLAVDFGRLRPLIHTDLWRQDQFTVEQFGNEAIDEKEATWTAYGQDGPVLSNRFDFILWDDLVTLRSTRTAEAMESQRLFWHEEGETRLDPGGTLGLVGQRIKADDLFRTCIDEEITPDDEENEEDVDERQRKYRHVKYPSHFEERCTGKHGKNDPVYPDGCLLSRRLPWRDLKPIMEKRPQTFHTVYQQEDSDPESVLVNPVWITGGSDEYGVYPGCWDDDRDLAEIPKGMEGFWSIATIDPSPTRMWAVQWWLRHVETDTDYLMDSFKGTMQSGGQGGLLDWNPDTKEHFGLMEDWMQRARGSGHQITHWIVEVNAAQRFLLQYEHVKRWQRKWGVEIVPHSTGINKLDPKMGVWAIVPSRFQFGRVRLPGKRLANDKLMSRGRLASLNLTMEATKYPGGATDDQIMAYWQYRYRLAHIVVRTGEPPVRAWRPTWMMTASERREAQKAEREARRGRMKGNLPPESD